jgi:3-hydroxyisobutyrate dehydrogenase-like beta-hydroxyacid dehydrogenase
MLMIGFVGLGNMGAAKGLQYLDAPVSGGVAGAAAGTLTFMIGGSEAAVERARPVLAALGGKLVHLGGLMNKDLHLALDAAQGAAQELPLTTLVAGLFARLAEAPRDLDTAAVIREIPGYAYLAL